jgi:hypothetical protein
MVTKLRRRRWANPVARMGSNKTHEHAGFSLETLEEKRLGRHRLMWKDNIKIDVSEIGRVWMGFTWFVVGKSGDLFRNITLKLQLP